LENHYYGVIETREFHKEKLRLVRIRNVWGPEGGWNGAFCDDSEEWDKHRNLREELKLVFKTSKKSDGTWWMSYNDWYLHFNRFFIGKVFPDNWESYSIPSKWSGKTAGGSCPPRMMYTE
jgi:calpain